MKKYLVEFVGTFIFVLTICCVVIGKADFAPIAIGSALMVMVYAGGHLSGGHYNPAVTFAVWVRGRVAIADVPWYMLAQLLGGAAAAGAAYLIIGKTAAPPEMRILPAVLAEFFFTFALCYVVLNTATAKATAGNSYFGLAIGFTVLIGAVAVGNVSGGAFNPAVAVGITLIKAVPWHFFWVFLLGNFAGAAAAGYLFKVLNPEDK